MSTPLITSQQVEKIAKLSRLYLTKDEVSNATKNLADILGHFSAIQQIDTSNTEITQNTNATKNVAREDVAKENNLCTPQDILDRAPATQNNHIEVSAVL